MSENYRYFDIATLEQLLEQERRNLQQLVLQAAQYGDLDLPLRIVNTINAKRVAVEQISLELERRQDLLGGVQLISEQRYSPQRRVFAITGSLRITLDQSAPGWMLSAENTGNHELTSITLTLRPPSSVLIARPRFEIPRLSVGSISKPHSLGLKADSTVTVPFSLVYRRTGIDGIDRHNGTITIAS